MNEKSEVFDNAADRSHTSAESVTSDAEEHGFRPDLNQGVSTNLNSYIDTTPPNSSTSPIADPVSNSTSNTNTPTSTEKEEKQITHVPKSRSRSTSISTFNTKATINSMQTQVRSRNIRGDGYGGGHYGRFTHHTQTIHHVQAAMEVENAAHDRMTSPLTSNKRKKPIQSHNYEPDESEVWRAYIAQTHFTNRGQWWTTGKKRSVKRWTITFLIGVIQACVALMCNVATTAARDHKFDIVNDLLEKATNAAEIESTNYLHHKSGIDHNFNLNNNDDLYNLYTADGGQDDFSNKFESDESEYYSSSYYFFRAFIVYTGYNLLYSSIASSLVFAEPVSAGSGIPEIKCFLNGIDLPRIVRMKTLICKVIGVTFSVAAGLPVGKEGPMVHSGAVVAAGISQGKTKFWGVDTSFSKFSEFRNDREKRDFVACGAAAGVASAFGAPIGGVLFSLEEGASFWSTKLTWRAFFCAMITTGTLMVFRSFDNFLGQANIAKLFSFGEFTSLTGEASNYSIWELNMFIIIGCLGGLIGAVFNAANENITIWRMKYINHNKKRRFYEVLAISFLVSIVSFTLPIIWNHCTELPTDMQDWTNQEKYLVQALVPFRCKAGKQYNEVASLMFTDADTAIKQLFHFREDGEDDTSTFSSAALFLFFFPYITLATLTYGIAIPSGLFVPSLLSGAAFGRLCGHLLHKLDGTSGTFADSGTYALMGAAAVLGGMARMTISLTVILLEATGDMQYVLPLMLTLMAARFTGNVFNEGLYDIHIKLKGIPFLEPEVPSLVERHEILAGQVMTTEVKCLRPVERAGVVYDLLKSCSHGNFPIVDTASGGTLYGTASRSMLCTLLERRAFGQPDVLSDYNIPRSLSGGNLAGYGSQNLGPRRLSPLVQWDTIERVYPRYPQIEDVEMRNADRNSWLDLRPYANTAPYTINETASIQVRWCQTYIINYLNIDLNSSLSLYFICCLTIYDTICENL